ncbi:SRPBCC family protein [Streptomyces sp. NPDC001820]|uniref:SRPBCC family protein n=1 Tax=Streptomyces sp. NPDC001820 TaxID=3364613 RepID=UPI0036C9BBB3
MARRLRPVELDFVESAPLRLVFSAEVSASPQAVYAALAEDVAGWTSWFSAVSSARPTHGGAGREIRLRGGVLFRETILATDPGERYAYRVDETNAPGLRALLEEWRITPAANDARVRWTFAADAPAPMLAALKLSRAGLATSFRGAVRNLDRRLNRSAAQ